MHQDRRRASSFGLDAERYDRYRPTYPDGLIDHLVGSGAHRVLDVGCGTGIAARLLAARGCPVLGVEPDERMAAVARAHGIVVETSTFEAWDPAGRLFDLVTSAQAWHWVDPHEGVSKAAAVLVAGGRLAVFWNVATLPPDLKPAIDAVYRAHAPGLDRYSVLLGNAGANRLSTAVRALRASDRFTSVDVRSFSHQLTYTTETWLAHLPTHSDHSVLDRAQLARLLAAVGEVVDSVGGRFAMRYDCRLVEAEVR